MDRRMGARRGGRGDMRMRNTARERKAARVHVERSAPAEGTGGEATAGRGGEATAARGFQVPNE